MIYPLVTSRPLSTTKLGAGKMQQLINYQERVEVLPGTPAAQALSLALKSGNDYENSFGFVLRGSDAEGLKVGHLSGTLRA